MGKGTGWRKGHWQLLWRLAGACDDLEDPSGYGVQSGGDGGSSD